MGFCNKKQYKVFMQQVPEFEHMLYEDGVELIKFWFSISKEVQGDRFKSRRGDPLKQWKISPVDDRAQENWDSYTKYKEEMFSKTHTSYSPWIIVRANDKKKARLESMRYVLSILPYDGKDNPANETMQNAIIPVSSGGVKTNVFMGVSYSYPSASSVNAEFLLNLNRANVAFSRAQAWLIVVCSESMLEHVPSETDQYESAMLWKALRNYCTRLIGQRKIADHRIRVFEPPL